jgi:hypothetical protein
MTMRLRQCIQIRFLANALWLLSGAAVFLVAGSGWARAEDSRPVFIPMIFPAEARDVRTSACFQVDESTYSQPGWWESADGNTSGPELAFKAVISAIRHKDRAALLKATDATAARDTKSFDEQANAFFQQLGSFELMSVPRGYVFDGQAVFFAKFRTPQSTFYAPFVFSRAGDGSFGFLPRRTRSTTYQLVESWFQGKWGPSNSATPSYCTADEVKRASHRFQIEGSPMGKEGRASHMYLAGASLKEPGGLAALATKVRARITEMKAALNGAGIDAFAALLTPEGGNRLKDWYKTAEQKDRSEYKAAIKDQEPFFLFDASPLVVVYLRDSAGDHPQVMYLVSGEGQDFLWANSSHLTVADKVFKSGPLYDAAQSEKPFSGIENK